MLHLCERLQHIFTVLEMEFDPVRKGIIRMDLTGLEDTASELPHLVKMGTTVSAFKAKTVDAQKQFTLNNIQKALQGSGIDARQSTEAIHTIQNSTAEGVSAMMLNQNEFDKLLSGLQCRNKRSLYGSGGNASNILYQVQLRVFHNTDC